MKYVYIASVALLAACRTSSGPDPSGTHTGATPVVVRYEPRPPGVPFDAKMASVATVAKDKDDLYKVTFGDCWATVKRPETPPKWKVVDGSICKTNLGDVKIDGGDMTVVEEGRMSFAFEGKTADGKTKVRFEFAGGIKS
ncbi:MAG TPA: hypothetical protein VIF62_32550 [Labilithrix sp.]